MDMKRILVVTAMLLTFAACSNDEEGRGDAGVGDWDDTPAHVINMPDSFMNVAFKCMGVNGIYAHTREGAPIVIPNDPMCQTGDN